MSRWLFFEFGLTKPSFALTATLAEIEERQVIRGWVVEGVVIAFTDADHAAFGDRLHLVGFTGMVFHMRLKLTTRELKTELTLAACREQSIDIETVESIQKNQR